MAKTIYTLRCNSCGNKFKWRQKEWPKFCPECGSSTALPERDTVVAPLIANPKHKSADMTYRQLEESSAIRAQEAADMAGVPVAEMSDLKVTNLKDNVKPGEVAAITTLTPTQQAMKEAAEKASASVMTAMGYAQSAHQGSVPYAGASALGHLRTHHGTEGAAVIARGQTTESASTPKHVQPFSSVVPTGEVLRRGNTRAHF